MIRRPRRTVPAVLVALVLFVAAVLVVTTCVQLLLESPPVLPLDRMLTVANRVRWDNVFVVAAGVLLAVVGVVLLACAWSPGVPEVFPLSARSGSAGAGVARRGLRRNLSGTARRVDGVSAASVAVNTRRVRARVTTSLRAADDLPDLVRDALERRLLDIDPRRLPRVSVRVRHDRKAR